MDQYTTQSKALDSYNFGNVTQNGEIARFVAEFRPVKPTYVMLPDVMVDAARDFVHAFKGTALYAVKTNPSKLAVQSLIKGGICAFDVASLAEIKLVRSVSPTAELHFMHPVKTPEDIHTAYFDFGVRHFVLDHEEELYKIMRETELAQDLNLTVRVALPRNDTALIDFSSKFGASHAEAIALLEKCRSISTSLGISFHVGTQTIDANQYAKATRYCVDIIEQSGVKVDNINIGGGFPVAYEDQKNPCSVAQCVLAVETKLAESNLGDVTLYAEPGRVLVARGAQLVTRVELRKGDMLFINDGVYGGLFDAASWVGTNYPVRAVSCDRAFDGTVGKFTIAGPTCDSLDMMAGPFSLPADIGIGDWVIFENVGAYSQSLRSDFNGFGDADVVVLENLA